MKPQNPYMNIYRPKSWGNYLIKLAGKYIKLYIYIYIYNTHTHTHTHTHTYIYIERERNALQNVEKRNGNNLNLKTLISE